MRAPRVTREQWRALQAVVDQGGFAQAAGFLNRSQSSVSYAVGKLQGQLGVPLLRIKGRKAELTEHGEHTLVFLVDGQEAGRIPVWVEAEGSVIQSGALPDVPVTLMIRANWSDPAREWLAPLLDWASPDTVYLTYIKTLGIPFRGTWAGVKSVSP